MTNIVKIDWVKDTYFNGGIRKLKDTNLPLNGIYEDEYGDIYYYKNGKIHNENGPSIIATNQFKIYCINEKNHRLDGPAVIYSTGEYEWCINDFEIDNATMDNWLIENNIPFDWNIWTDSDKKKFADYWTEKYGTPYATDNETKPEENKYYVIETKDDNFVLTGDSVSILKQILQIKNLVSIREAKINNL